MRGSSPAAGGDCPASTGGPTGAGRAPPRAGSWEGTWERAVLMRGRARGLWSRSRRALRAVRRDCELAVIVPLGVSCVWEMEVSCPEVLRMSLLTAQKSLRPWMEILGLSLLACLMVRRMKSSWSKEEARAAAPRPSREKNERAWSRLDLGVLVTKKDFRGAGRGRWVSVYQDLGGRRSSEPRRRFGRS